MKQEFHKKAHSGAVYGLGLIGAAVYFISHATGFWMGVLGFLKAIVVVPSTYFLLGSINNTFPRLTDWFYQKLKIEGVKIEERSS